MIEKLKHKYALSDKGAKAMIQAFVSVTISNLVLMFPVGLLYVLASYLLEGSLPKDKVTFFTVGVIAALLLIAVTTYIQYNATFLSTYVESGVRRRMLAEKLRRSVRSDEYDHGRLCVDRDGKLTLDSGIGWCIWFYDNYYHQPVVL